ncbi:glycerophosphodiester phosphodiesterase family protein [Flammeovirga sp. MY04]|uniref:glycerophosphodiester phosphodiesterase family protein n=1 Tax=Flammeovirga sp. MY04 TaxID=1191459 RepID=UPI00080628D1|nr:glycerophosphodiester phosphodiesterase family protein [Flammeovirga sp. MY04]ANQ50132.1 glycerophosphodiester phosphodiesterase family protein [Flammeovirga sp. MY04]
MKNLIILITFLLGSTTIYAQKLNFESVEDFYQFMDYNAQPKQLVSAHRGGPYPEYPENCIPTFKHLVKNIYAPVIELDVEMSKDSVMFLMHDNALGRTTTGEGSVRDYTWKELQKIRLKDDDGNLTKYKFDRFDKVLKWTSKGYAVLTVDVKKGVPFEMIVDAIRKAKVEKYAAVITYNWEDAKLVHKLAPELMISVTIMNNQHWEEAKASGIPFDRMIAFTGVRLCDKALLDTLHEKGIFCINATFHTSDKVKDEKQRAKEYQEAWDLGVDIIATDLPIEAENSKK